MPPYLPTLPAPPLPVTAAGLRAIPRRRRRSYQLPPKEEETLLQKGARIGLGGLATVGHVLGTPVSLATGTLAGEPGRAIEGIFDPSKRIYGREMLRKWGVVGRRNTWGNFLAGLAAEAPFDPLFWVSGPLGSTSRAGRVAKSVGLMDNLRRVTQKGVGRRVGMMRHTPVDLMAAADNPIQAWHAFKQAATKAGKDPRALAKQPLGGLMSLGPLGTPSITPRWATGPTAQKIGGAMDVAGEAVKRSAPIRFGRMLFSPATRGWFGREEQKAMEAVHRLLPQGRHTAKLADLQARGRFQDVYRAFDEVYGETVRGRAGQAGGKIPGIEYAPGDVVEAADRANFGYVQAMTPEGATVFFRNPKTGATAVKEMSHDALTLTHRAGTNAAEAAAQDLTYDVLDKMVVHLAERPRQLKEAFGHFLPEAKKAPSLALARNMQGMADSMREANRQVHRAIEAKGGAVRWIEGADLFEHFPRSLKGAKDEPLEWQVLRRRHPGQAPRVEAIRFLDRATVNNLVLDPAARGEKAVEHILRTYGDRLGYGFDDAAKKANKTPKLFHAEALAQWVKKQPQGKELFTERGLDSFLNYQLGAHKVSKSLDAIHELFNSNLTDEGINILDAFKSLDLDELAAAQHLAEISGRSLDELDRLAVPKEIVRAAEAVTRIYKDREWASLIGGVIDTTNRWFKANVTLPFPAFWSRNHVSGQYVNAVGLLENPRDIADYSKAYRDVGGWWMNPKKADQAILRELEAHELLGLKVGFEDVEMVGIRPGVMPEKFWNVAQTYREAAANVAGSRQEVLDRTGAKMTARAKAADKTKAAYQTMLATGSKANQTAEFLNRATPYVYLRRKGWTAEAAARRVKELQFDYSDLSPFERSVMRRVIPFWTFTRKMGELLGRELLERPGGPMGQTIRLTSRAHQPTAVTPDYIASGTAVPLAPGQTGEDRYLTGFGLAHEDPLSYLGGGVRGAGLEFLSRTNPLFKGPVEWFTGQSFFQKGPGGGRRLEDLDPMLGRTLANVLDRDRPVKTPRGLEAVLANTPLTRYLTTTRTLTDPRKGPGAKAVNLLTGFRVTDVPQRTQEGILRERLQELMKPLGARTFEKVYFPQEALEEMPPATQEEAMRLQLLMRILGERAKKRAKLRQLQR